MGTRPSKKGLSQSQALVPASRLGAPCANASDCPPDQMCTSIGECQCRPGLTACGDQCYNTSSDSAHCGGCKITCPRATACQAGRCGGQGIGPLSTIGPAILVAAQDRPEEMLPQLAHLVTRQANTFTEKPRRLAEHYEIRR